MTRAPWQFKKADVLQARTLLYSSHEETCLLSYHEDLKADEDSRNVDGPLIRMDHYKEQGLL